MACVVGRMEHCVRRGQSLGDRYSPGGEGGVNVAGCSVRDEKSGKE